MGSESAVGARVGWTWRGSWPWLAAVNAAVFVLQDTHLGDETIVDLAVPTGDSIDGGEIWRPLSSLVVHPGGLVHLGINTALLAAVGGAAERALGRDRFLLTYFGAGFATNAVRYAVGGETGGGASAAIFAVGGAALASWLRRSDRARYSGQAILAAILGGTAVAAAVGDNHLLALGLGGAIGHSAASPTDDREFAKAIGATVVGALGAMAVRVIAS